MVCLSSLDVILVTHLTQLLQTEIIKGIISWEPISWCALHVIELLSMTGMDSEFVHDIATQQHAKTPWQFPVVSIKAGRQHPL